jgi:hypothetical protein
VMRLVTEALRHWSRADRDGVTLDVRTRCTNSNNVQRQRKIFTLLSPLRSHSVTRHVRFRVEEDEGDAPGRGRADCGGGGGEGAERANAERIARSFEELQQRVAATEAAQRAASAQSQSTPSATGGAGAGTESYGAQVNSLIAQLQADQRMQYGPGAGMGLGLPAFNLAGLTGQPHGRDAAPSLGFGAAEPVQKKAKSEMSLQELVALHNGSASGGSSDSARPMVTTRQVESMFGDYVAYASSMKAGRSAEMRHLLLLMYMARRATSALRSVIRTTAMRSRKAACTSCTRW